MTAQKRVVVFLSIMVAPVALICLAVAANSSQGKELIADKSPPEAEASTRLARSEWAA